MGLTMYGQMTAGSWIYIGSQGIVQGIRDVCRSGAQTFRRVARWKIYSPAGWAEWVARNR